MDKKITKQQLDSAVDRHLSYLAELFYRVHTDGIDKVCDGPKHFSNNFINAIRKWKETKH